MADMEALAFQQDDEYEDYLYGDDDEGWTEPCHECDGTGTVPLGSGADLEMDCSACGGLGYQ